MNITPLDRSIFKNIPESVLERQAFEEAKGLNKFLWLYTANYGTNDETAFGAMMTTEMGLQHYAEKELKENGIVQFPLSDRVRYYPPSGGMAYAHYFEEFDTQKLALPAKMLENILAAGKAINEARDNAKHGGRMKSLLWTILSAGVGVGAYLLGTSYFINNSLLFGTLLTLPILALMAICGVVALYNLWRVFVPRPEDESIIKARGKLKTTYYDALRYIRLRVLWYQSIYDTDEIPETLCVFQRQLDDAIHPWKDEVE